jgi:ribose transport system permease protein
VGVVTLSVALRIADIGRNVYALGGNPVAARLAGIPITRCKIAIYAVTSLTAGVGGVSLSARAQNGVLLLGVLQNGLTILNVRTFHQQVATGVLLVVAVMLQQLRSDRPWAVLSRGGRRT